MFQPPPRPAIAPISYRTLETRKSGPKLKTPPLVARPKFLCMCRRPKPVLVGMPCAGARGPPPLITPNPQTKIRAVSADAASHIAPHTIRASSRCGRRRPWPSHPETSCIQYWHRQDGGILCQGDPFNKYVLEWQVPTPTTTFGHVRGSDKHSSYRVRVSTAELRRHPSDSAARGRLVTVRSSTYFEGAACG
jgi:hypothetical protein